MSEKLTMPKNVQAFVNKYGGIGSKEQDATFWKEFRKAANAYADVQAKRICDLEHALAAVTEQRDRLSEALKRIANNDVPDMPETNYAYQFGRMEGIAKTALQPLTPKP